MPYGEGWTTAEYEHLLETLFACDSEVEYERAQMRFSAAVGKDERYAFKDGPEQMLRRIINRCREYVPENRTDRTGQPWTWAERMLLKRYGHATGESRKTPDIDYWALVFARTPAEIEREQNCGIAPLF